MNLFGLGLLVAPLLYVAMKVQLAEGSQHGYLHGRALGGDVLMVMIVLGGGVVWWLGWSVGVWAAIAVFWLIALAFKYRS